MKVVGKNHALTRALSAELKLVLRLLDESRKEWFPEESLDDVLNWTRESAPRMADIKTERDLIAAWGLGTRTGVQLPDFQAFRLWCECAHLIDQSEAALERDNVGGAVRSLVMAALYAGAVSGLRQRGTPEKLASELKTESARMAANAKHEKSRARKADIQAWYSVNRQKYRSLDAAAEKASTKFSVAFRTARKYIGEANKNLPSARRV